jgi:intracellular septation protein
MKFLFDLFPIILFFVAFKLGDIYTATIVAMSATIGQILWVYYRHRKIDAMQWISLVMIVVFGSLTIFLHDKTFIQLKPTALYWLFSGALFISAQFFQKNWIQVLMGKQVTLKEKSAHSVWHQLIWHGPFSFLRWAPLIFISPLSFLRKPGSTLSYLVALAYCCCLSLFKVFGSLNIWSTLANECESTKN